MARLPVPGSDNGTWGDVLNEFLGIEHNADGTQKTLPVAKGGTGATDAATARTNLSAASTTDLAGKVDKATLTTKGDMYAASAASTPARVAVGSDNTVLTAASAQSTGVTWTAPSAIPQTINAQTGTTYTLVLADAGALITLSNVSAITLTVPLNSSVAFAVGTHIDMVQTGAGQVTVAGAGGVTVNSTPTLKFRAQYSGASLVKTATDTWLLLGDLAAS